MLLRYPEVSSLHFEPETNLMRFTFLCQGSLPSDEVAELASLLDESLDAYAFLEGVQPRHLSLQHEVVDGVTVLELERDVDSLTPTEISMVISLLRDRLDGKLVAEGPTPGEEEEQTHQDEIIESLLDDLRTTRQVQRLIAFREEGRVLVFNK